MEESVVCVSGWEEQQASIYKQFFWQPSFFLFHHTRPRQFATLTLWRIFPAAPPSFFLFHHTRATSGPPPTRDITLARPSDASLRDTCQRSHAPTRVPVCAVR